MNPISTTKNKQNRMKKILNFNSNRLKAQLQDGDNQTRPFNSQSRNAYVPLRDGVFATSPRMQKVDEVGNEVADGFNVKTSGHKNYKGDR